MALVSAFWSTSRRARSGVVIAGALVVSLAGGGVVDSLTNVAAAVSGSTLSGGPFNLRSGPGVGYAVVGSIGGGQPVDIRCTATGSAVTGPYGTTTVWDRLGSDAYITEPTSTPADRPR